MFRSAPKRQRYAARRRTISALLFFSFAIQLDVCANAFCVMNRTGRVFTLFYDQMAFLYTKTTRKPSSDIRFTCQNFLRSPSSRTQSTSARIYLDFFPHRETFILRLPRHRMRKNGWTRSARLPGLTKKRAKCTLAAQWRMACRQPRRHSRAGETT